MDVEHAITGGDLDLGSPMLDPSATIGRPRSASQKPAVVAVQRFAERTRPRSEVATPTDAILAATEGDDDRYPPANALIYPKHKEQIRREPRHTGELNMNTDKNPQPDEQPNKVFCCPECGSDEITVVRTEVHEYSAYPETSWNPTRERMGNSHSIG